MTYVHYVPQSCRKGKHNVYQLQSYNIHQQYNIITEEEQNLIMYSSSKFSYGVSIFRTKDEYFFIIFD